MAKQRHYAKTSGKTKPSYTLGENTYLSDIPIKTKFKITGKRAIMVKSSETMTRGGNPYTDCAEVNIGIFSQIYGNPLVKPLEYE